ncbi:MAG: S-methyl-5-thioribose-1-phosphate isomerase [Pseudomonadales bacterium]|jgi:methylthioribose-1-phosphate isomerase|nr:S-methyl-5-thioribose-1-phosphate isomerase [Pseudomonadales bacterium]
MTRASASLSPPPGIPASLRWEGTSLAVLDQTALPHEISYRACDSLEAVRDAIVRMQVRGAPAIGIAAAWGLVLGMQQQAALPPDAWLAELDRGARRLASARPTAVNLAWAMNRMTIALRPLRTADTQAAIARLTDEAAAIEAEDRAICAAIGEHGMAVIPEGARVLTHCNAGALAVSAWGTALAPIYRMAALGRAVSVFADETRPVLQGARLTAWELQQAGIDVTLITDSMAAHLMARGEIDLVLVGTDRITANGDVVNKIGTLGVAVLARHFGIPFWVACPSSTWDPDTACGADVEIEERSAQEVTHLGGVPVAAPGVKVRNPAFDVTPAALVTGVITERGIARQPLASTLGTLLQPTRITAAR